MPLRLPRQRLGPEPILFADRRKAEALLPLSPTRRSPTVTRVWAFHHSILPRTDSTLPAQSTRAIVPEFLKHDGAGCLSSTGTKVNRQSQSITAEILSPSRWASHCVGPKHNWRLLRKLCVSATGPSAEGCRSSRLLRWTVGQGFWRWTWHSSYGSNAAYWSLRPSSEPYWCTAEMSMPSPIPIRPSKNSRRVPGLPGSSPYLRRASHQLIK